MIRRPHVVARGERAAPEHFPDLPSLGPDALCDGVVFLSRRAPPAPDLRPIREAVTGIWRGQLGLEPDAPHLLVVAFLHPRVLDAEAISGLPLRAAAKGVLASFVEDLTKTITPGASANGEWRWVELWWNGHRHRLSLDRLQSVSPAILWDAPRLTFHAPRSASRAPTPDAGPRDGLSKVAHARITLRREAGDAIDDVEARLRAIDERTRLSAIFKQFFIGRGSGRGGRVGQGGSNGSDDREPGVLENLQGWLRWHTPLGAGLRAQFANRMTTVERLLAKGDLDTALRLALALGGGKAGAGRLRFPTFLPGLRASLDLTFQRGSGVAPIFGARDYQSLHTRYADLAAKLEADGDFRRAAYVHSKLLDNHAQAVLALERGGLFGEAAKLALKAELEPTLTIRLLFKAGEQAAALNLAKRTGCFDQLADESREKEPAFHGYVVDAWTELLIATNQPLRALQVTDLLAGARDAPPSLLDKRRGWLEVAAALEEPGSPAPETVARAVLAGPQANTNTAALGEAFAQALRGATDEAGGMLVEVLRPLARLAAPERSEQSEFWRDAAPHLEDYALALIALAPERLGAGDLDAIRALLDRAGLSVLSFDIGKLNKLYGRPAPKARTWHVPVASVERPRVRAACVLGAGQILSWRESQLLQLFDRHGGEVWRHSLSDVVALTPIGTGPDALIVQQAADGAHQLTRLATQSRRFHPIGKVRLNAWHDVTSEGQWLAQIGGEIGALDLAKLCLPTPEIEFLWSAQVTERLTTIAFGHAPGRPQWLTRDISESRAGVLELWTMNGARKLETDVCIPSRPDQESVRDPARWFWAPGGPGSPIRTADARREALWRSNWSARIEQQAVRYAAKRSLLALEGLDTFQSCDFGRPYVWSEAGETARTFIQEAEAGTPRFTFEHALETPMICLARSAATPVSRGKVAVENPGRLVFTDNSGRLFLVEMDTLNIVTF